MAVDGGQKADMNQALAARIHRFPPIETVRESQYWRARVDRAIATRLLYTDRMLRTQREFFALVRYRLTLKVATLARGDGRELGRLARQTADYYRSHLLTRAKRLREHIARYTSTSLHHTSESPPASMR